MKIISIRQAKIHFSRLIEEAAKGESFVIAKAGKPLVKVMPVDGPAKVRRIGFMNGEIKVPEDFDQLGGSEIERLFGVI